ncbi:hypothetical protein HK100_010721, partial [Physocladia obscura]
PTARLHSSALDFFSVDVQSVLPTANALKYVRHLIPKLTPDIDLRPEFFALLESAQYPIVAAGLLFWIAGYISNPIFYESNSMIVATTTTSTTSATAPTAPATASNSTTTATAAATATAIPATLSTNNTTSFTQTTATPTHPFVAPISTSFSTPAPTPAAAVPSASASAEPILIFELLDEIAYLYPLQRPHVLEILGECVVRGYDRLSPLFAVSHESQIANHKRIAARKNASERASAKKMNYLTKTIHRLFLKQKKTKNTYSSKSAKNTLKNS